MPRERTIRACKSNDLVRIALLYLPTGLGFVFGLTVWVELLDWDGDWSFRNFGMYLQIWGIVWLATSFVLGFIALVLFVVTKSSRWAARSFWVPPISFALILCALVLLDSNRLPNRFERTWGVPLPANTNIEEVKLGRGWLGTPRDFFRIKTTSEGMATLLASKDFRPVPIEERAERAGVFSYATRPTPLTGNWHCAVPRMRTDDFGREYSRGYSFLIITTNNPGEALLFWNYKD